MVDVAAAEIVSRREPNVAQIVRLITAKGFALEPEALAMMGAAYQAVLEELRMPDREDAGTLMIAKHIVELAGQGERDAQRLTAAALAKLSR